MSDLVSEGTLLRATKRSPSDSKRSASLTPRTGSSSPADPKPRVRNGPRLHCATEGETQRRGCTTLAGEANDGSLADYG
jgi:hypothetical protein